jgi:hypothetical protein
MRLFHRFVANLTSSTTSPLLKREFAHVHDVQIKWERVSEKQNKEGSMSFNGMFIELSLFRCMGFGWAGKEELKEFGTRFWGARFLAVKGLKRFVNGGRSRRRVSEMHCHGPWGRCAL